MINKKNILINKKYIRSLFADMEGNLKTWVENRYFKIAIFNIIILMLVLLRSAGYFHPYFTISINFIVLCTLFLSTTLLGLGSRFIFTVALILWVFAAIVRILGVDIWAERISIYVYQAIVLGVILIFIEKRSKKSF